MALHLSARLHAAAHGLFAPRDAKEARSLYDNVAASFAANGLESEQDRRDLMAGLARDVAAEFGVSGDDPRGIPIAKLVHGLIEGEGLFQLPEVDWSQKHTIAEYWAIKDQLKFQQGLLADPDQTRHLLKQAAGMFIEQLYQSCPSLYEQSQGEDGITLDTNLLQSVADLGEVVNDMQNMAFAEELIEHDLLNNLRARLEANLIAASGGNPADPASFNKAPKYPNEFNAKNPEHLIQTYLGGTVLEGLFDQTLPFTIPTKTRFEHHHIVAGSGHGKTQTLQYLIAEDLDAVARGERSVVVIDSQGDLINNISNLAAFAPGGPLHDRIVIIDPSDVEWPVSLNLFDVGMDRIQSYAPLERERLTNSILELYDFVLGSLLDAAMTQKQSVIFRYVTRLMLHIPNATIHTLRELMESGAEIKFAEHINKLSGSARQFFETEFSSKEFDQTKRQVSRRLWGILENQTFERMFSHPKSKLNLFAEMQAGKVILINIAKDLLKEQGSQIFGRFFIAMIAQAAQERAVLPADKRLPTFVYVDEAADYFDRNIGIILAQARKYNVGMVLAHQYLGQLDPGLQEAFGANTSIKFAGGVSAKDARSLAPMLHCDASFIESQPKGSFAAHVRGVGTGAVPLSFPFGVMESLPKQTDAQRAALQDRMREQYAMHYSEIGGSGGTAEKSERVEKEETATGQSKAQPGQVDIEPGSSW